MPHIIVEYTESAIAQENISTLLHTIHQSVAESNLFDKSHVRTRAYPFREYTNGNTDKAYIHIQARIKSGRNLENKKQLSKAILEGVSQLKLTVAVITVEIIDMDRDSYSKLAFT